MRGIETLVGPRSAFRAQAAERRWHQAPLGQVLESIEERCNGSLDTPTDEPLFVFSAGWRSGSTLLQRLVVSSGHHLWGEPYARSDLVRRLAESLRPISATWPRDEYLDRGDVADGWIANLFPPIERLVESHRAFFRTLFSTRGRWGFKEVRLGVEYAVYLRFLFPHARFIFLVRDPSTAYASYKQWRSWYSSWPDGQVRTPRAYGRMWRDLAAGFSTGHENVGGLLLRYEDLTPDNPSITRLEEFLGSSVDHSVLERRIRGSARDAGALGPLERRLLRHSLHGAERAFGYRV